MKTKRIAVIAIMASILLVPAIHAKVFADEPANINPKFKVFDVPEKISNAGINDVTVRAVFDFSAGQETIDSFKMFDTGNTGFNKDRGVVNFVLQGVVSDDRPLLYEAVDTAFSTGAKSQNDFKIFDVDVMFTHGDKPYKVFSYDNCIVKNYNITVYYDRDETFIGKFKWPYVDKFEFECVGVTMWNPTYDQMLKDQADQATADAVSKMKKQSDTTSEAKSKEVTKAESTLQKLQQKTFR